MKIDLESARKRVMQRLVAEEAAKEAGLWKGDIELLERLRRGDPINLVVSGCGGYHGVVARHRFAELGLIDENGVLTSEGHAVLKQLSPKG